MCCGTRTWLRRRGRATPSKLAAGTAWRQREPACKARLADRHLSSPPCEPVDGGAGITLTVVRLLLNPSPA